MTVTCESFLWFQAVTEVFAAALERKTKRFRVVKEKDSPILDEKVVCTRFPISKTETENPRLKGK